MLAPAGQSPDAVARTRPSALDPPLAASPRRVAFVRALQLGDLLCAVPALRALRVALPEAHLTLVGLPWARVMVDRFPAYLDGFIEFPGFDGIPERDASPGRLEAFRAAAEACSFDVAIQAHGDGRVMNRFMPHLCASRVAGFRPATAPPEDDAWSVPYPDGAHEVERLLCLVEAMGARPQGKHLEFPLHDADFDQLERVEGARALLGEPFACVHPGARSADRRWPSDRFAAVADALAAAGMRVALTGSEAERGVTAAVVGSMQAPGVDLAGRTSLGALGALLSRSRLLVTNDTGVAHLASALRIPSVVIFSGSDPARWAPLDRSRHRALGAGRRDGATSGSGGLDVAVDDAVREAMELLRD